MCFTCVNGYYRWQNWTDTAAAYYNYCDTYCPNRASDYKYTGQYIPYTNSGVCYWCSSLCAWCADYSGGTKCFACVQNSYLWLNYTDATYFYCSTSCPNRRADNVYPGQYIANAADHTCTFCNATCSWCADYSGGNTCYTCITTAYLLANHALCVSSFPYDNGYCYPDYECISTFCPTNLYFKLPQSSTTLSKYPWTSTSSNTYLTWTNVCYLCHVYCLQCTDNLDSTCSKCSGSYYKWQQAAYGNRCNYYCIEGSQSVGGLLGEYVDPTTSVANRACVVCAAGCQFCAYAAAQCYVCQNNYYLIDDKSTCTSTFNCPQCLNTTLVTDGCQTVDKYCRTTCPTFFYFTLYLSVNGGSGDLLVTNSRYDYFTNASSLDNTINGYEASGTARSSPSDWVSPTPNTNILYRRLSNICKLCDFRCMKCFGPSNFNCTLCVDNYYLWTNAPVC